MRIFFAIDRQSQVGFSTMRQLLSLQMSNKCYALLRLEDEHFPCLRTNFNGLFRAASWEGKKIFDHYSDATACVVVVRAEVKDVNCGGKTAPVDYAVSVTRSGGALGRLLNPKIRDELYWASSPDLQPQLAEAAIEFAGIQPG